MKKLLYLIANPNSPEESFGRKVGDFILDEIRQKNPETEVSVKDLYREGTYFIDQAFLSTRKNGPGEALTPDQQTALNRVIQEVDDFLQYDRYIIVTPMWNFSIPPFLKAYIDLIIVPGKTFQYTAEGPVGLLTGQNKKVMIVQSSGGIYSSGPAVQWNYCSRYLEDLFHFIGINQVKTIMVEGTAIPGHSEVAVKRGQDAARLALSEF